ncbi:hypothetical protein RJT34_16263 [Clitoria ternatea]|uniref:Uncharacterized protein n=1 Tax=Clitoria ternatea TaxID=43366 RepID=A0AAN9J8V8_CLITE
MGIEIEQPCVELSYVAVSETHGENSPYFAGSKAYDENPYDEITNSSGVIQMGLAKNQGKGSGFRENATAGATAANELLTFILANFIHNFCA